MLQRSAQVLLASLFFFVHLGCVQTPVSSTASRDVASLQQGFADKCKALLKYKPEQQFDFNIFCGTRDRIASGEPITLDGWERKSPEELMAIIEAFSLASFGSGQQLEEEKIKISQARLLKAKVIKLQKSKKNRAEKVHELIAYWYRLTHEKSAYKLFKNNAKSVEALFLKISEEKRIQRIEAEVAKRGVIEAFESVGFQNDATFWQKFKDYSNRKRNEKNLLLSVLFTIPAVVQSNVLFAFFPVWDFAKVERLAYRYQEIAFESGHEKAHEILIKESRIKGTFASYAKILSHAVNTGFMAALIVTGINSYNEQVKAESEVIEMLDDSGSIEDANKTYMDKLTDSMIKGREEKLGRSLSAKEKQEIRDLSNTALNDANSKANVTK